MEAIFLVRTKEKLNSIYVKDKVKKNLKELLPIDCYTKNDVVQNKSDFVNVKYIFSTWYMPTFTETEVKECFPALKALFYAAGTVKKSL